MVIALFVDNEYSVENEILIKQPKQSYLVMSIHYEIKTNLVSWLI